MKRFGLSAAAPLAVLLALQSSLTPGATRIPLKLLLAFALLAQTPAIQSGVTSGQFTIEPPTLVSLGFEWTITGDDNRNARVDTAYRKRGESQWREGLPLLRLQREQIGAIPRAEVPDRYLLFRYTAPNMFAGSILNLDPDTEYECRFTLSDPDGVKGASSKTVTVRTRKEPQPAAGGRVYHVYPVDNVFAVSTFTNYSSSDYNGFRPVPGKPNAFEWSSPRAGVTADFTAYPPPRRFNTFANYREGSGQDRHSILVDYDVFIRVAPPDAKDPQRVYQPDAFDFHLKAETAPVDAGIALPSITDGFTGRAPDLGALEAGEAMFKVGPRSKED